MSPTAFADEGKGEGEVILLAETILLDGDGAQGRNLLLPETVLLSGDGLGVENILLPAAFSRGAGLRVDNVSPPIIEAGPHEIITATFRVVNETGALQEIEIDVGLPPGWYLISGIFPFTLRPGEEELLFVAISIPRAAYAGDYTVTVDASTTQFFAVRDRAEVDVKVVAVAQIEVHPPAGESRAFSGEVYEHVFTVVNLSNASSRFEVQAKTDKQWDVKIEPGMFTLDAGESRPVTVSVTTPEEIPKEVRNKVTLIAHALDLNHGTISAKAGITTTVYPRLLEGDLYHVLPGSGSLLFSWDEEDDELASQVTLDMEGDLGEGRYGELHFAGPYPSDWRGRRFLEEDAFKLKYSVENKGYFSFGDDLLHITPLTERYFYGRGVDMELRRDDFAFRTFYSKRRHGWLPERLAGAQFSLDAPWNTELMLTGLMRKELQTPSYMDRGKREGSALTLSFDSNPAEGVELEAEYGWGEFDDGEGGGSESDSAYRIAASISREDFDFDGEVVRAGDDFPGYWQGSDLSRGYLSVDLSPDVSAWGSISEWKSDAGGDPLRPHGEDMNRHFGIDFTAGDLVRGSVYRRWSSREDTNLLQWDEENHTTNIKLSHQFDGFSITGKTAFGKKCDHITGTESDIHQYGFIFTAAPAGDSVFSGGYAWDIEQSALDSIRRKVDRLWLNADIRLNDRTDFIARFSRSDGPDQPNINWLRTELEHRFGGGKIIHLMSQWRGGELGNKLEIALKFSFPLSLPITMLPKSGRLEGVLVADTGYEGMLSDVVVAVDGVKVATDGQGRFVFPALPKGEYELTIERSTLGLDLIPAMKLPSVVTVTAGKTVMLTIPIARAATVNGRVAILQDTSGKHDGNLIKPGGVLDGLSGAVVILENGDERYERVTDAKGRFAFSNLRPGHWKLILAEGQAPLYYEFAPTEHQFELESGQSLEHLDFFVSPMDRPIIITAN